MSLGGKQKKTNRRREEPMLRRSQQGYPQDSEGVAPFPTPSTERDCFFQTALVALGCTFTAMVDVARRVVGTRSASKESYSFSVGSKRYHQPLPVF